MSEPPVLPTPRRWYQSGGFAVFLLLLLALGAVLAVRALPNLRGTNTNGRGVDFTTNPRALARIPTTTAEVATPDDPALGPADAKVTVVEFADYQCPFCRQAFPTFRQLMNKFGDRVRFQIRDYPVIELHPDAENAAEAAECAWEQGADHYWAYHDRLYLNQSALSVASLKAYATTVGLDRQQFDDCLDGGAKSSEVEADYVAGLAAGVRGTPTFFVNQRRIEGAVGAQLLEGLINAELVAS